MGPVHSREGTLRLKSRQFTIIVLMYEGFNATPMYFKVGRVADESLKVTSIESRMDPGT